MFGEPAKYGSTPIGSLQIPGQYLFVLSECVDDFRIERKQWLASIDDSAILATCAETFVSFNLFQKLALRAAKMSNNPALGFSVGQRLTLASHGVLGYALMLCSNLLDAATIIEKYISIRMPLIRCETSFQGDEFVITFEEHSALLEEMRILLLDGLLLTVKTSIAQLVPSIQDRLTICFPSTAHNNFPYKSLFGCKLQFDCGVASIRIPQELVTRNISGANIPARQEAETLCKNERDRQPECHSYASRIQNKLLEQPGSFPNLEVVASWFNITQRTLHRRLLSENTSYKVIVQDIKLSLAKTYLLKSTIPIKEISYFLGYEEAANFRRAFKRWTGYSPSDYRAQLSII